MSVGTAGSSQSGEVRSRTSGLASSAASAIRAAASAARTISAISSAVVALPLVDAAAVPAPESTNDTTVALRLLIWPLVVSVLLAQRRLALVVSRTITTQSSAVEQASAC